MLKWKLAHDTLRTQETERQTDRQDKTTKKEEQNIIKTPKIFRIFGNERKLRQLEIVFMRRASCATKQPQQQPLQQ